MVKPAQKVTCPECGTDIKAFANGNDLALPDELSTIANTPPDIFAGVVPCPFCTQGRTIPEWARSLRPGPPENRRWRFTYRGIL